MRTDVGWSSSILGWSSSILLSPEFVRAFMSMRLRADCRASRSTMRQKTFDAAAGLPIDFGLAVVLCGAERQGRCLIADPPRAYSPSAPLRSDHRLAPFSP